MSDRDFKRFSTFIYTEVGIKLPPAKKTMVEARLQKRLRFRGMSNIGAYLEYLFSPQGMQEELVALIDVVTTNTTDFFREPQHFDFLANTLLPAWIETHPLKTLHIWSAGCSIGMEPYTLAIVLSEFASRNPGFRWNILATDISTQALETAIKAIYDVDRVKGVPRHLMAKYFLRSKDRDKGLVRIAPQLRNAVTFRRLNFMEEFNFQKPLDIIFCRNVVIYFDKPTQQRLFTKFCRCLVPNGHLFIGHSESLSGMDLPLQQLVPTVYKRL